MRWFAVESGNWMSLSSFFKEFEFPELENLKLVNQLSNIVALINFQTFDVSSNNDVHHSTTLGCTNNVTMLAVVHRHSSAH